jgi:antitoxin component of RelBE/YafQ-DinJ toxin-antitoxin module
MSKTISVRLDEESLRALRLLEATGLSPSEAIRKALAKAATDVRGSALRAEARRLAESEEDREEIAEVQALMEELRAEPW